MLHGADILCYLIKKNSNNKKKPLDKSATETFSSHLVIFYNKIKGLLQSQI